jgi:peptidoglycan/LPS O-acetylase OafA/YrhL
MGYLLFLSFMALASALSVKHGNREHKTATAILVCGFVFTYVAYAAGDKNWLDWPVPVFVCDLIAFILLARLALRSKRFWPLPIASLQLLPVITPLVDLVGKNLISNALGWTQGIWGYLQLIILIVAAIRLKTRSALPTRK